MNEKKSKQLRRRTRELMLSLDMSLSEGHNEYKQVENCVSWEHFTMPDGTYAKDADGTRLMKPVKKPGTIELQWRYRLFYKFLKRLYKKGEKDIDKVFSGSAEELRQLVRQ